MEKEFTVRNKFGLHARPAAMIANCASNFEADITVNKSGELVNAKRFLGIMTLSAGPGTLLIISAEGVDEEAALTEISKLFDANFDEE